MEKNERIHYLDILNVISALAVVFLHVNGCFWKYSGKDSLVWWKSSNVIESFFYFAVPVFFMISGATLLDYNKKYSTKVFFKKRIFKTVIPYIIWSVIGLVINLFLFKNISIEDVSVVYVVKGILTCQFVQVYWFFIVLFNVYLSIPLLAAVDQDKKIKIFLYTVISALVINVVVPFIISVFSIDMGWSYQLIVGSGYIIYILIGYLLKNCDIRFKYRCLIYLAGAIGLCMHIFGTYYLSSQSDSINTKYKGYCNLPCLLYSVAVFVFAKYLSQKISERIMNVFAYFSRYTFGIYLVHIFIIRGAEMIFNIDITSIAYRLLAPIPVFLAAFCFCWIIKRFSFLKIIIP